MRRIAVDRDSVSDHALVAENVAHLRSYGTGVGLGNASVDTDAFNAAIVELGANYSPTLYLGAGDYVFDNLLLDSVRGIKIVGEGVADATEPKTRFRLDPGKATTDALLKLKSCANLYFEGIFFDINGNEGMDNLILFQANGENTVAPRSKYGNNFIFFTRCVFHVPASIVTPPTQNIWAKSCSNVFFTDCYAEGPVAYKFGADTDIDPINSDQTISDGRAGLLRISGGYTRGDIIRERVYGLTIDQLQFYSRTDAITILPVIRCSGNGVARDETLKNNLCDPSEITSYTGAWFTGGSSADSGNVTAFGNQITARNTCFRIERGSATIFNNRPIALGPDTTKRFVSIGENAGDVRVGPNHLDDWLSANESGQPIEARTIYDERSGVLKPPVIISSELSADYTFVGAASFIPIISTTYKFGGQRVEINYTVGVLHNAADLRTYTARVRIDNATVNGTTRRVSGSEAGQYLAMSCHFVVYIDATDEAVEVELEVSQASGAVFATVQGNSTAETTLTIKTLEN